MTKGHFSEHPLYQNEADLAVATEELVRRGYTIFQIFQFPYNEADHAAQLLSITDPEHKAMRVLSLGSGVGGMEAMWQILRPEMTFELVNISQAQLNQNFCRSAHIVCDNAETYRSEQPPFDLVVISYLLGHVNVHSTLNSALANLAPWGRMLIYDIFEGTQNMRETLHYDTPSFAEVEAFGCSHKLRFRLTIQDRAQIPLSKFFADNFAWVGLESRPGLFVFQRD